MGGDGGHDCRVVVEAASRFFGDALILLLAEEGFETEAPTTSSQDAVDVVLHPPGPSVLIHVPSHAILPPIVLFSLRR